MVATWSIWHNSIHWTAVAACVLMVSCHRTQPQRPTYHGKQHSDTTAVQLLTLNQRMADEADLQLTHYAAEGYARMEENYWVKGLGVNDCTEVLPSNEYISIEAGIYNLQGGLLTTHQANVQMQRVDEIPAIVHVLPMMRRNQTISMLVPWYLAFGSAGNQDVPPYENVRIELTVK